MIVPVANHITSTHCIAQPVLLVGVVMLASGIDVVVVVSSGGGSRPCGVS